MKILLIGGSGNISANCTLELLRQGHEVVHFNRGNPGTYQFGQEVVQIQGDASNPADRKKLKEAGPFDVVANFIAFVPDQVKADLELFRGICDQYIFISSATVYEKPPSHYLITEDCRLSNPFWEYARNKIACEQLLSGQDGLPYTIVRPSYTYGKSWIPVALTARSYSPVHRIKNGIPLIVHGDGESLWVNTHAIDFARAFAGLPGNPKAINTAFHITSDEVLTWNEIYRTLGRIVGQEPILTHIPSDFIHRHAPDWGDGLLGDKSFSVVFDNSKIKDAVPGWKAEISFEEGVRRSIEWFESDSERMRIDEAGEKLMDQILTHYHST